MLKKLAIGISLIFASLQFCENAMAKQMSTEKFFLVAKQGQTVYDKERKVVSDRLLLFVSISSSDTVVDEVPVVIEAVAKTAADEIADNIKNNVDLPELVYKSVQNLSEKVFAMNSAKTKKEFNKAKQEYEKVFEQSDSMISLHGFRLVKHSYSFHDRKV